jgi:hypothetical protein
VELPRTTAEVWAEREVDELVEAEETDEVAEEVLDERVEVSSSEVALVVSVDREAVVDVVASEVVVSVVLDRVVAAAEEVAAVELVESAGSPTEISRCRFSSTRRWATAGFIRKVREPGFIK